MKKFITILIVAWFIVAGGVVLMGGIYLMASSHRPIAEIPSPPPPPDWTSIKSAEDAAKVYAAQTSAYEKQLAAINAKSAVECAPCLEVYKTVAKDTLQPLLNTILAALLGYVFVKGTATLVNNQLLLRRGQEPEKLDL